jgi:hypothetical protein
MPPNAGSHSREAIRAADSHAITCQICLEELSKTQMTVVTHFCSVSCPAVFCAECLHQHLQVAMKVPYAGALPKIRCPICLVAVNKHRWTRFLDPDAMTTKDLTQQYTTLCEDACCFTCPGCHHARYTQLPKFYQDPTPDLANAVALTLLPSQEARIPELRRVVRRFCTHDKATTARDVIRHIEDNFPASKTDCIMHKTLARIQDEERRATLLLAYHSIHRRIVTRCCGMFACFNCKRSMNDATTPCPCEEEDNDVIQDEAIIECRSCRVMLVKVDGCSSVLCVCGFSMCWSEELRVKKLHQRKLLPVDPFDRTLYYRWVSWHETFQANNRELGELALLHSVNNSHPGFRDSLRRFVWKRRYRKLLADAEVELRHKCAVRQFPAFKESLRALVWRRRRFHRKLLDELRMTFVARTARSYSAVLKAVLLRFMWFCRFRYQVLGPLRRRQYCVSRGWTDLSEDQQAAEEECFAMLSIGLN